MVFAGTDYRRLSCYIKITKVVVFVMVGGEVGEGERLRLGFSMFEGRRGLLKLKKCKQVGRQNFGHFVIM